jgi:uncharacterized membrane protein (DUF485 family)
MLHEPAGPSGPDLALEYKKRVGVWMFLAYSAVYAGFVLVNLFSPRAMETIVLAGTNLAVVYGYGLIVLAVVLSLVYTGLCSRKERELEKPTEKE